MSFTQETFTIDQKGYADMDEVMTFIRGLPKVQRVIIRGLLTEEMFQHPGNKAELTEKHVKSDKVMAGNWLYNLG